MENFIVNETGKVEFFGMTTATPDFLNKQGILHAEKGYSADGMVQVDTDGALQLYILEALDKELRVVPLSPPQKAASLDDKLLAIIKKNLSASMGAGIGELLYRAHYEDNDTRAGMVHVAYDAAISAGVTHATARWFGVYFVQDALFGFGMDQEFTDRGVFRGPAAFSVAPSTVKKQLSMLQLAGLLRYEAVAKQGGFYVQFNRLAFPGLDLEKLPNFFNCLLY